jgi:hypothetical protein
VLPVDAAQVEDLPGDAGRECEDAGDVGGGGGRGVVHEVIVDGPAFGGVSSRCTAGEPPMTLLCGG